MLKHPFYYLEPQLTPLMSDGELESFCPIGDKEDYVIR